MKKFGIGAIIIAIIGVICMCIHKLHFYMLLNMQAGSVSVIGGADGPTAIFIAENSMHSPKIYIPMIVITILALVFWVIYRRKH